MALRGRRLDESDAWTPLANACGGVEGLARELGVTYTAIWKWRKQIRNPSYPAQIALEHLAAEHKVPCPITRMTFAKDAPRQTRTAKYLRRILEERDMMQTKLVELTGLTQGTVSMLVNGKMGISAATALRLEKALGIPAIVFLIEQAWDDLDREEKKR